VREAEITCLCNEIRFRDLGLSMTKGEVRWVSEEKARKSLDLKRVANLGAVRLEYRERFRFRTQSGSSPITRKRIPSQGPFEIEDSSMKDFKHEILSLENSIKELKEIILTLSGNMISGFERQEGILSKFQKSRFVNSPVVTSPAEQKVQKKVEIEEFEDIFIPSNLLTEHAELEKPPEKNLSDKGFEDSAKLLKQLKHKKFRR